MENAAEALKIAFAVMMFILALSLSVSSFSQANEAVKSIINMSDRENEYTYVESSGNLTRTVGVETIVPSMYRAYSENIEIYFKQENGEPLDLYYKTDQFGNNEKTENGDNIGINYIKLNLEALGTPKNAIKHLDILLGAEDEKGIYRNQIIHDKGLYEFFKGKTFTEELGEYYQGTGSTKSKKRVITYTLTN